MPADKELKEVEKRVEKWIVKPKRFRIPTLLEAGMIIFVVFSMIGALASCIWVSSVAKGRLHLGEGWTEVLTTLFCLIPYLFGLLTCIKTTKLK
ncbi:hypothetical protein ACFL02_03990 [Planctomycetota bacterium]